MAWESSAWNPGSLQADRAVKQTWEGELSPAPGAEGTVLGRRRDSTDRGLGAAGTARLLSAVNNGGGYGQNTRYSGAQGSHWLLWDGDHTWE